MNITVLKKWNLCSFCMIVTFRNIHYFWFMRNITLNIPDSVSLDDKEVIMLIASRLYERGILSLGQAAELAGLTKRVFAESLGKYNVSIFNYPASDLASDVNNA